MEKLLLIVDDSKEIIELVEEILGGIFDKVIKAETVEEANEKLSQHTFSFIVLDINLAGRNGGEVVKYLNEYPDNVNAKCPVVILSGIINDQFVEKHNQRFAGVMMKPFDHDKLLELVQPILNPAPSAEESVDDEDPFADLEDEEVIEANGDVAGDDIPDEVVPEVECVLPFPIPELEVKVAKIVDQIKKSTKLKQLFQEMKIDRSGDNYIMSHIGMLINISTSICTKLEWNTEKTLEKFVYAAYLHDMALSKRPDLARISGSLVEIDLIKEKKNLSQKDYQLILDHPTIASNRLDEMKEIPPDVSMIIRQHHELPKENGFPAKLPHAKITPLATVFIISHDMVHYILENPKWTLPDYINKAKLKFKGPHFAKILSALRDIT